MSSDFKNPTIRQVLRYRFGNLMAQGAPALAALLGASTLAFITLYAIVAKLSGILPQDVRDKGTLELVWYALMRAMDAGTLGGDVGTWAFLLVNLVLTLFGIFVVSALIGIINAGLEGQLTALRKGRSVVVEREHTVILGYNAAVPALISELVIANENRKNACIVVLSPRDKVELEDELSEKIPELGKTRLVVRTGEPSDRRALDIVSIDSARSIIVVSPAVDEPDLSVIKSLLAIVHRPERKSGRYHIVAELRKAENLSIAKMVGRDEVVAVVGGQVISKIAVQSCRQSGLSVVVGELLDFAGDEIYFTPVGGLAGKTFGDALLCFPKSAPIGVARGETVTVLPPLDQRLLAGDELIAISADDDTLVIGTTAEPVDEKAIVSADRRAPVLEKTLVLGWNEHANEILTGLDAYVAPGSSLILVAPPEHADAIAALPALERQQLEIVKVDPSARSTLDALDLVSFDQIIVLAGDEIDAERADEKVLVTLLHLRDIGQHVGKDFSIVSEMRSVLNRELAEITDADDFVVDSKLVSLFLAQISENRRLSAVLNDLFDPAGAEIYLKRASDYVAPNVDVNFATVVEAARRRGEIAIGYRLTALEKDPTKSYGVFLNPAKAARQSFLATDRIIVVAAE